MDLHHAGNRPDWETVPAAERNRWQRWAADSGGWLTPGNMASLLGIISVPLALWWLVSYRWHIAAGLLLTTGRACDLLDGWLAARTGTKSPLGEKLDASLDKASTLLTVVVGGILGLVPVWAISWLAVPQLVIAVLALSAWHSGQVLHPSRLGKLEIGAAWLSLLAFIVAPAFTGWLHGAVRAAAICLLALSLLLALGAIAGYARRLQHIRKRGLDKRQ